MPFASEASVEAALARLHGTAGHLLKIWLVLKRMGLAEGAPPVRIDTKNSTEALTDLFAFGDVEDRFFVPFAHTKRYSVMKGDASRSIVQTTIQRWVSSGSVVTCDPTGYLDIQATDDGKLEVSPGRIYPQGLGHGESGFAIEEGSRVAIPIAAFAIWAGRWAELPEGRCDVEYLIDRMCEELNLTPAETAVLFVEDDLALQCAPHPISPESMQALCAPYIDGTVGEGATVYQEDFETYARRVGSMTSQLDRPAWLRSSPDSDLERLLALGAPAILLYGPPRTGKTRLVDNLLPREDPSRETVQMHDGWGYDQLIEAFIPDADGRWDWRPGVFTQAIAAGKSTIVLEEVNRTNLSQALGETFSLLEWAYRGEANAITLRGGGEFWIPEETRIIMTMNTIDKSTEEIDDALLGRLAAIEVAPDPQALQTILGDAGFDETDRQRIGEVFAQILSVYPLGHGYFAGLVADGDVPRRVQLHYKTRIRPVLLNFLGELRADELSPVDNLLDDYYG